MSSTSTSPSYLESVVVESSTTTSIHLTWQISPDISHNLKGFRVHYQKEASQYIQYGPMLSPSTASYDVNNLVADTFYKVCLVLYRNDTAPMRQCVGASTTNWRLPVSISIGSSIGAMLALSMIVIMVLAVARCPFMVKFQKRKKKYVSRRYDSMSSHFTYDFSDTMTHDHDGYISEDQCDSTYDVTNQRREQQDKRKMPNRHKYVGGVRPKIPLSDRRQKSYLAQTRGVFSSTDSQTNSINHTTERVLRNGNTDLKCSECLHSEEQHSEIDSMPVCMCENCSSDLNRRQVPSRIECSQCQLDGSIILHTDNMAKYPDSVIATSSNDMLQNRAEKITDSRKNNSTQPFIKDKSKRSKSWSTQCSSSISQSESESAEFLPVTYSDTFEMHEISEKPSILPSAVLLETCIDDEP